MFNRRLLVDSGGDTSGNGTYSLLVGSFGDANGTLWRGYFTTNGTKGAITPNDYAGYPIKSCYIQLMTDESLGLILINVFIVELEGEFIMRELTTEEFEEIEKALYKEGNRKVIATLEGD